MSHKTAIATPHAPEAVGTYAQAIRTGNTLYISGQIGLDPHTQQLVDGTPAQIEQVFANLAAIAQAAGGSLDDVVKLTVYLADMADFPLVNAAMAARFTQPYPARAAVGVQALPRGARVEIDAIVALA